ncbi:cell envelope biogenesis protein OmpA [Streptomyces fructofermentans]|uniref:cell envelope biogenesis protein OmpA n=1 Tax=Streptomyces fructofermentans TaxID=152141 RepID=UPI00379F1A31
MHETVSRAPSTGTHSTSAARPATRPHPFRDRIGVGLAGGFYPAPHRYRLFLREGCPRSLRVRITLDLLGLRTSLTTTVLARSGGSPDALASLRGAYEATWHHYEGPLTAPALCDRWTGRVVSNHTPDILRDLAALPAEDGTCPPVLRPPALAAGIDALRALLDRDLAPAARPEAREAALALLEVRFAPREEASAAGSTAPVIPCPSAGGPHVPGPHLPGPYALGGVLTAADVDLWVALGRLEPGALSAYPRLQEYAQRLARQPAFRDADPTP